MLSLGLGASTHSFEVMLAAFILGMSAGAFWLRNRLQAIDDHPAWLAGVLLAKAVFAVAAIWVYAEVLEFIAWMMRATARTDAGYTLTTLAGLGASMAVMFPTAFCAGMTLPLATHALTSRGHGEAAIGRVYGANTFNILTCSCGTPGRPVNAIPPKAVANCQLRFVAGTWVDDIVPAVERHLKAKGHGLVKVLPPPPTNDGAFSATRTEPDHPWAAFV